MCESSRFNFVSPRRCESSCRPGEAVDGSPFELYRQPPKLQRLIASRVCTEMNLQSVPVYYWTDSKIALGYIANSTRRFRTFVSNRIAIIHSLTKPSDWGHVPSEEKPADLPERASKISLVCSIRTICIAYKRREFAFLAWEITCE